MPKWFQKAPNILVFSHQIDEKSIQKRCSKKLCENDGKRCRLGAQKGATIKTNVQNMHAKNDAEIRQ